MGDLVNTLDSSPSEYTVLGAILNDPSLIDEFQVFLTPDHFANSLYARLYTLMCHLWANEQPVDLATIVMKAPNLTERIGSSRLINMQQAFVGKRDAQKHAERLLEIALRRNILQGSQEVQERATDLSISVDELKSAFETIALGFSETTIGGGLHGGETVAENWWKKLQHRIANPKDAWGMTTGWNELDEITLGYQRQDLIIVGGRTSVGKTAFAIENLIRVQSYGWKCAMFSLEMSEEQVHNRIAGNMGMVPLSKIRTGECNANEVKLLEIAKPTISSVFIDDMRGVTADYIVSEMKRHKRMFGLDFVIIDYIQEVNEPAQANDNNGSALGRAARKIRKAARDCDCAVMLLSQATRDSEGKKPKISELAGSAGLESAADVIILLHRDKQEAPNVLEVDVAKQRNGKTDMVTLAFDGKMQRITSIDDLYRKREREQRR